MFGNPTKAFPRMWGNSKDQSTSNSTKYIKMLNVVEHILAGFDLLILIGDVLMQRTVGYILLEWNNRFRERNHF